MTKAACCHAAWTQRGPWRDCCSWRCPAGWQNGWDPPATPSLPAQGLGQFPALAQSSAGLPLLQVFLRAGQMAVLDKMRTDMMHEAAITIQRHIQGFIVRRRFLRTRAAIVQLQVTGGNPVCRCTGILHCTAKRRSLCA